MMPYITQEDRLALVSSPARTAGELNFLITELILDYYKENGGRYQQINDVVGALEGAKLEFYRRLAAPYEDGAISRNGDVYL